MEIHDLASPAIAAARGTVARVVAASLGLLLALGAAPARAQDAEETLDEGVAPRATVVG